MTGGAWPPEEGGWDCFETGLETLRGAENDTSCRAVGLEVWGCFPPPGTPLPEWLPLLLDEEERGRAQRFLREVDRRRFILAHGLKRLFLARYTGLPANSLRFTTNRYGKPVLANGTGLHFNLSHSGHGALVCLSSLGPVGIDVEYLLRPGGAPGIVERFFSAAERHAYLALEEGLRREAFFRAWTRKEAYIKALGLGLSLPLDAFSVSLGARAEVVEHWADAGEDLPLLFDLRPAEAHRATAALVVRQGEDSVVRSYLRVHL